MEEAMADRQQAKQRRPAITLGEKRRRERDSGGRPASGYQGTDDVHGEGNYKASREFDEAEREFVQSSKLDEGIRNAAPKSEAEQREMEAAEEEARRRAKEEDPALLKKPRKPEQGKR
jgi:hypothetical protein